MFIIYVFIYSIFHLCFHLFVCLFICLFIIYACMYVCIYVYVYLTKISNWYLGCCYWWFFLGFVHPQKLSRETNLGFCCSHLRLFAATDHCLRLTNKSPLERWQKPKVNVTFKPIDFSGIFIATNLASLKLISTWKNGPSQKVNRFPTHWFSGLSLFVSARVTAESLEYGPPWKRRILPNDFGP